MRASSESQQFEEIFTELAGLMARWILDPRNHSALANAINNALGQYDQQYAVPLVKSDSESTSSSDDESELAKAPPSASSVSASAVEKVEKSVDTTDVVLMEKRPDALSVDTCSFLKNTMTTGFSVVYDLTRRAACSVAETAQKQSVEWHARMHSNRARQFREIYGKNAEINEDTLKGGLDAKVTISSERAMEAFLDGLLGSDGWKISGHLVFFGNPSLKTLIMNEVLSAFKAQSFLTKKRNKEGALEKDTLLESYLRSDQTTLSLLRIPEQAHTLFLQIKTAVDAFNRYVQSQNNK